jgi:hypothetical protein
MHDTAAVTGSPFTPTGSVTFTFFAAASCAGDGTSGAAIDLVSGAGSSANTSALHAGSYSYSASYSGSGDYNSSTATCENFNVSKADSGTSTTLKNGETTVAEGGSVALGTVMHDTAAVTGSPFTPTGSVTFTFFTAASCASTGTAGDAIALDGTNAASANTAALGAGAYSYRASYSGSDDYNTSTSSCENFNVSKGTLGLTTDIVGLGGTALPTVHDTATVTGATEGFAPTASVSFSWFTNTSCTSGTASGTAAIVNGLADGSTSHGPLAAGSYAFRASYPGDSNYETATSDCEPFTVTTITINKLANGTNSTFDFTVTGPTSGTPSITTTGTPGTGSAVMVVTAGSYTVGETVTGGWQLVGLSCGTHAVELGPTSSAFTAAAGTNTTCGFENTKSGATRTQGFWATHTGFSDLLWASVPANLRNISTWNVTTCANALNRPITANTAAGTNQLMGSFWANVAKTSTNGKRADLDQARMQLLQQLSAALLNSYGLGTGDGGKIATAMSVYCGTDAKAITGQVGILGSFNQSGDTIPLSFPNQQATTALSKSQADIKFWDTTK